MPENINNGTKDSFVSCEQIWLLETILAYSVGQRVRILHRKSHNDHINTPCQCIGQTTDYPLCTTAIKIVNENQYFFHYKELSFRLS